MYDGKKIEINNFKKYIESVYPNTDIYYDSDGRWEVGVVYKPDQGNEYISFVNGISSYNGGTHVNYIVDNIIVTKVIFQ